MAPRVRSTPAELAQVRDLVGALRARRTEPLVLVVDPLPNPDLDAGWYAGAVRRRVFTVATLAEAQAQAERFQAEHQLGGGNWRAYVARGRRVLADMSYNGRLWHVGAEGFPGAQLTGDVLQDPAFGTKGRP